MRQVWSLRNMLAVLYAFCWAIPQCALAAGPSEAMIKAIFVAKMVQMTEWPEKTMPANKLRICVTGRNPTADALLSFDGQTSFGRNVSVGVVRRPNDALDCHILFLIDIPGRTPNEWLHEVADHPILTISESEDFALIGGIVGLYRDGNRVAFDVSLPAMRRAGLHISTHLLKLARNISGQ